MEIEFKEFKKIIDRLERFTSIYSQALTSDQLSILESGEHPSITTQFLDNLNKHFAFDGKYYDNTADALAVHGIVDEIDINIVIIPTEEQLRRYLLYIIKGFKREEERFTRFVYAYYKDVEIDYVTVDSAAKSNFEKLVTEINYLEYYYRAIIEHLTIMAEKSGVDLEKQDAGNKELIIDREASEAVDASLKSKILAIKYLEEKKYLDLSAIHPDRTVQGKILHFLIDKSKKNTYDALRSSSSLLANKDSLPIVYNLFEPLKDEFPEIFKQIEIDKSRLKK